MVGKLPQPLADAAAAVSVITAADLEAGISLDLHDALAREPGVSVGRDPQRFGTGGITVRGLGGNRVLVETDGVPGAKSFSIGSFSNTGRQFADLEVVERIELLRGPASALYGSDAIAGVLAITTVDPADVLGDVPGATLRARAGHASDDGSSFAGLTGAMRAGPFEGLVAYARREGGGLDHAGGAPAPNPRDYSSDALLARAVLPGDARPLRLSLLWNRDHALTDVDALELSGGRFANTIRLEGDDRAETLGLLLDQAWGGSGGGDGRWRLYWNETTIGQYTDEERRAAPPATPPLSIQREFHYRERAAGGELTLARAFTSASGPHRLLGGLEFTDTEVVERRDGLQTNLASGAASKTILGEVLPVRDFPVSRIREAGAYIQDDWRPGNGAWSLVPALRADWYRLAPQVDGIYAADNPREPPVRLEETSLSPKLAVGWRLREGLSLYLQYSHGYRSPPFDDVNIGLDLPQFNTRAIPNPDLEAERSDSLELGLRFAGGIFEGTASIYASRYRDFIESRVNIGAEPGSGTTLFQSRNLARAEILGAEAALDADLGAWRERLAGWKVRVAAGMTSGEDTVRDQPINSIDPPRGTVGLRYDSPSGAFGTGLDLTLVGAKHDVDESAGPLFRPGGYARADLRLRLRLGRRAVANVGLFNLGDERYYEWATARGRAPGDPLLPLYREPGRHFALMVSATFD